jgi:hypothetical protein
VFRKLFALSIPGSLPDGVELLDLAARFNKKSKKISPQYSIRGLSTTTLI